jgi:hypothetical protein
LLEDLQNGNDLIFVSIASYRDPDLASTIKDCLQKACYPNRIRIGVCQQREAQTESLIRPVNYGQITVLDVPWQESKGVCWARSEIMKSWDGEEWYLQVDSHCRFASGWDTKLINSAIALESPEPIISTYACAFSPGQSTPLSDEPLQVGFRDFTPEGIPCLTPVQITNWRSLTRPLRARFVAAGFLFARGHFVERVPYDAEIYFLGEEITLSLRAFTSGYDLFHPCEPIVWHEYKRSHLPKHWSDHVKAKGVLRDWHALDERSKAKVKQMLAGTYRGPHGLGTVRTLREYECYAGIGFATKKVQVYTSRHCEPPNPDTALDWATRYRTWKVRISLDRFSLAPAAFRDPAFWYFGVHDENEGELYRKDLSASEIATLTWDRQMITIERTFDSDRQPCTWTVWPKSRSGEWLQKVKGDLDHESRMLMD